MIAYTKRVIDMKTILNFGGFYESWHSARIDQAIERCAQDDSGDVIDEDYEKLQYDNKELELCYSRAYVDCVNELLKTKLKFFQLISPREYNFSTDRIEVEYDANDEMLIRQFVTDNDLEDQVRAVIKHMTTSRSGYSPYYTFDEVALDGELFLQCVFDVLIKEVIDNTQGDYYESEWASYYDNQHVEDKLSNMIG